MGTSWFPGQNPCWHGQVWFPDSAFKTAPWPNKVDRSQKAVHQKLGIVRYFCAAFGIRLGYVVPPVSLSKRMQIFKVHPGFRYSISLPGVDLDGFANAVRGSRLFEPGTGSERLQPWRELASHDLCQLAWIFRRHSWHVQRDLEVWSHDRGCVGGIQASHLYLHPQARWVAWWCLGGHWSGHQPWEDGDWAAPIVTSMSVPSIWPKISCFFGTSSCPFELAVFRTKMVKLFMPEYQLMNTPLIYGRFGRIETSKLQ